MTELLIILIFSGLFIVTLRTKALAWMAARPFLTMSCAIAAGVLYRRLQIPPFDPEAARLIAQLGLGILGFFAAQQVRFSRLHAVSAAAFRLAVLAPFLFLALFSIMGFIVVPGLGILSAVLVGAALMLGGAPPIATPLLSAPIDAQTKAAARIEGGAALAVAIPVALLIEAGATPVNAGAPLATYALFKALAGFAVGGAMGLLAGRFLKLPADAAVPVMPFLVAFATFGAGLYTGFDPVMCAVAGGLLYSEEAPLRGDVRTRIWRIGEGLVGPIAIVGFGFLIGPLLFQADLLIWLAAVIAVVVARGAGRLASLQRTGLPAQDQMFLVWYGGAPGAAAALMLISIMHGPSHLIDETALQLAAGAIFIGVSVTRAQSRPLTSRLVQATARARKRRYGAA